MAEGFEMTDAVSYGHSERKLKFSPDIFIAVVGVRHESLRGKKVFSKEYLIAYTASIYAIAPHCPAVGIFPLRRTRKIIHLS